jgi:hypothetical protein
MVPLSAGGSGIFPVFFDNHAQSLLEKFQAREQKTQPVAVVAPFHLFQRLKAPVQ